METTINNNTGYNYKHVIYLETDEHRFYTRPIKYSNKNSSSNRYYNRRNTNFKNYVSPSYPLTRTKSQITDMIFANSWYGGYFLTLTFDPTLVNCKDYNAAFSAIEHFTENMKRNNPNIKYILIPELHSKGTWHFHGIINYIDDDEMIISDTFKSSENNHRVSPLYFNKGINYAKKISDNPDFSIYNICFYITKNFSTDLKNAPKRADKFIASSNLKEPMAETFLLPNANRFEEMNILKADKNLSYIHTVEISGNTITYIGIKHDNYDLYNSTYATF